MRRLGHVLRANDGTPPHADLVRRLDPWAPTPAVRIEMMRRLHEAGIDAGLGPAPVLPALTDDEPSLDHLLGDVTAAGVKKMFMNLLFLRSPTNEKYLRWQRTREIGGRVALRLTALRDE